MTVLGYLQEVLGIRETVVEGRSQTKWLKRAAALEQLKDWQVMLDWCLKWTKSEPEDAAAWFCLGLAYDYLNRYDDAIEAYRQALRINPEDASTWYNLGVAYAYLKRYNDAIEAYRQALRIKPEYASTWYNLGLAYADLKRYNDAIEAYRQALRIKPEDFSTWYNLGNVYGELNRHNDAIGAYRQALSIDPEKADAWANLGYPYVQLRHYDDAIDVYRQALRINPEHVTAWYGLATAYGISRNRSAALEAIQNLRRLDPTKADKLFNLIERRIKDPSLPSTIVCCHDVLPVRSDKQEEAEEKTFYLLNAMERRVEEKRFVAYADWTIVLDTRMNLMWASKDNGYDINWNDAKRYCENYRRGGYTDWRMPTQYELSMLHTLSFEGNNRYHLTDLIILTSCCLWTSETRAYDRSISPLSRIPVRTGVSMARVVDFSSCECPIFMDLQPTDIGTYIRALPVRSSPKGIWTSENLYYRPGEGWKVVIS